MLDAIPRLSTTKKLRASLASLLSATSAAWFALKALHEGGYILEHIVNPSLPYITLLGGLTWLTVILRDKPSKSLETPIHEHGTKNAAPVALPPSLGSEIRVISNNTAMLVEIQKLLEFHANEITKVKIVQYSCTNIKHIVALLLEKTTAHIEVYFVDPSRAREVNNYQADRTEGMLRDFPNETRIRRPGARYVPFTYDAPGSVRALLIKDHVLFFGAYQYEVAKLPHGTPELDTRGNEKPMFMIPCGHPHFKILADQLENMVTNWKTKVSLKTGKVTARNYNNVSHQKAKP